MADRGHLDPRLDPPPLPAEVETLWQTFFLLSAARRSGFGAHPITYVDIDAYCRLAGVRLTPWELETLIAMDSAALAVVSASKGNA